MEFKYVYFNVANYGIHAYERSSKMTWKCTLWKHWAWISKFLYFWWTSEKLIWILTDAQIYTYLQANMKCSNKWIHWVMSNQGKYIYLLKNAPFLWWKLSKSFLWVAFLKGRGRINRTWSLFLVTVLCSKTPEHLTPIPPRFSTCESISPLPIFCSSTSSNHHELSEVASCAVIPKLYTNIKLSFKSITACTFSKHVFIYLRGKETEREIDKRSHCCV